MAGATHRLDNFTDAAFAFALSLLVIGQNAAPTSLIQLQAAVADVPAFAIGFAIIAMFWFAHVRWRALRGDGGWLSNLLTIALVFLVLIYIRPLQGMASSLSSYLGGSGTRFVGDLGGLFFIYGLGFTVMAAVMVGLFAEAARDRRMEAEKRRVAKGEALIWAIVGGTGLVSTLLTLIPALRFVSPFAYATLPATVPLAAWLYGWDERAGTDDIAETA